MCYSRETEWFSTYSGLDPNHHSGTYKTNFVIVDQKTQNCSSLFCAWEGGWYSSFSCSPVGQYHQKQKQSSLQNTVAPANPVAPSPLCIKVQEDTRLALCYERQVVTCSLLFLPSGSQIVTSQCHSLFAVVGSISYHSRISESRPLSSLLLRLVAHIFEWKLVL